MDAVDYRQMTWEAIQERLTSDRLAVWHALQVWGPRTTRQLAKMMDKDILSVRPRVTELCQMGFAKEVDVPEHKRQADGAAREGYYLAVGMGEAEHAHRHGAGAVQSELKLGGV